MVVGMAKTVKSQDVFKVGVSLGLVIEVMSAEGIILGVLHGPGQTGGEPADLKVYGSGLPEVTVQALTPDGEAFIELVSASPV